MSLNDTRMSLPEEVQRLLPEANLSYYEQTNEMHCGKGHGGSKFDGVSNIFEVIGKYPDLAAKVARRSDDREALLAAGAPESAFLPAVKGPGAPEGLPEALYYKVEGMEGRLQIEQLQNLPPETKVVIRREKGSRNPDEKTYTPASFTAIVGEDHEMPKTDFATVIVGRDAKPGSADEVWTVHPGAPIRTPMRDFDFTRDLRSPEEMPVGEVQDSIEMTVGELLERTDLQPGDYIKLAQAS